MTPAGQEGDQKKRDMRDVINERPLTWQSKLNHLIQTIVDGPIKLLGSIRSQDQHKLVRLFTGSEIAFQNYDYCEDLNNGLVQFSGQGDLSDP